VYKPSYNTATVILGYNTKVYGYPVRFDLTVDNVLDEDKPLYIDTIARPPGGDVTNPSRVATPNRFSYITPRNVMLKATVSF
jgi:hypothetical protein